MKTNEWDFLVSSAKGVLRYDGSSGKFQGIFASGDALGTPTGLRFGPDGNLYVGNVGPDNVLRYDGKTGEYIGVAASHPELRHPRQVAFSGDRLFVSSRGEHKVLSFDLHTGALIEQFSKPRFSYVVSASPHAVTADNGAQNLRDDGLSQPFGLIKDPGGNLLVASFGTDSVRRYDGETGVFVDTFAAGQGLMQPRNIVYGPDGNLYMTTGNHQVMRFDGLHGAFIDTFVPAGCGGLRDPYGLEFGSDGNLYVVSGATSSVLRYDGQTGAFLNTFVQPGGGGLDAASYALFVGGLGGAFDPSTWRTVLRELPA
jgi:hypothetical protein